MGERWVRIYYDTEFVEDGSTIRLLSIGLVREDGEGKYLVVQDNDAMHRAVQHDWLRENVVSNLPVRVTDRGPDSFGNRYHWVWDGAHPDFKHAVWKRQTVARIVREFIDATPDPQLWAWYGAYDHVAYAQLFGRMVDLPDGFPMATFDVKQEAGRLGVADKRLHAEVPNPGRDHNALHDAMWAMHAHEHLLRIECDHHLDRFAKPFGWES
jgi:hypothetical protein